MSDHLTKLENISLTKGLIGVLQEWNSSKKYPHLGKVGAHLLGCVSTPLTALIDTVMHSILFAGKLSAGIFVTPYNAIARAVNPKWKHLAPKDLEIKSSLTHLSNAINSLFQIVILPPATLCDLNQAKAINQPSGTPINAADFESAPQTLKKPIETQVELKETISLMEKDIFKLKEHYKDRAIVNLEIYVDQNKITQEFVIDKGTNEDNLVPKDIYKGIKHKLKTLGQAFPKELKHRFVVNWSIILEREENFKSNRPGDYAAVSGWRSSKRDEDEQTQSVSRMVGKNNGIFPAFNGSLQSMIEVSFDKSGIQTHNIESATAKFEKLLKNPSDFKYHNNTSIYAPSLLKTVEKISLTQQLMRVLQQWNTSESQPILGKLGARIIGFISTPLTALIDALAHMVLFIGKTVTGLGVTPYNFIVEPLDPKYRAPKELGFGSALIHLAHAVNSFFNMAIAPLLVVLDFDYAHAASRKAPEAFEPLTPMAQEKSPTNNLSVPPPPPPKPPPLKPFFNKKIEPKPIHKRVSRKTSNLPIPTINQAELLAAIKKRNSLQTNKAKNDHSSPNHLQKSRRGLNKVPAHSSASTNSGRRLPALPKKNHSVNTPPNPPPLQQISVNDSQPNSLSFLDSIKMSRGNLKKSEPKGESTVLRPQKPDEYLKNILLGSMRRNGIEALNSDENLSAEPKKEIKVNQEDLANWEVLKRAHTSYLETLNAEDTLIAYSEIVDLKNTLKTSKTIQLDLDWLTYPKLFEKLEGAFNSASEDKKEEIKAHYNDLIEVIERRILPPQSKPVETPKKEPPKTKVTPSPAQTVLKAPSSTVLTASVPKKAPIKLPEPKPSTSIIQEEIINFDKSKLKKVEIKSKHITEIEEFIKDTERSYIDLSKIKQDIKSSIEAIEFKDDKKKMDAYIQSLNYSDKFEFFKEIRELRDYENLLILIQPFQEKLGQILAENRQKDAEFDAMRRKEREETLRKRVEFEPVTDSEKEGIWKVFLTKYELSNSDFDRKKTRIYAWFANGDLFGNSMMIDEFEDYEALIAAWKKMRVEGIF